MMSLQKDQMELHKLHLRLNTLLHRSVAMSKLINELVKDIGDAYCTIDEVMTDIDFISTSGL